MESQCPRCGWSLRRKTKRGIWWTWKGRQGQIGSGLGLFLPEAGQSLKVSVIWSNVGSLKIIVLLECGSVVRFLPSIYEDLGLIPSSKNSHSDCWVQCASRKSSVCIHVPVKERLGWRDRGGRDGERREHDRERQAVWMNGMGNPEILRCRKLPSLL